MTEKSFFKEMKPMYSGAVTGMAIVSLMVVLAELPAPFGSWAIYFAANVVVLGVITLAMWFNRRLKQ